MATPRKPIEDANVALTIDTEGLYGDPFFHWARCELEHMWQADDLAEELTKLGYEVVVDDYTVSWEPPPDEIHIGSHPPLRVRSATAEDLARDFGSSGRQAAVPRIWTGWSATDCSSLKRWRIYWKRRHHERKTRPYRFAGTDHLAVMDTNAFLHYRLFNQVDWSEVVGSSAVRLVVPLRVIDELDLKKAARRSELRGRARTILRHLEGHLESGEVRPGVRLDVVGLAELDPDTYRQPELAADVEILDVCEGSEPTLRKIERISLLAILVCAYARQGARCRCGRCQKSWSLLSPRVRRRRSRVRSATRGWLSAAGPSIALRGGEALPFAGEPGEHQLRARFNWGWGCRCWRPAALLSCGAVRAGTRALTTNGVGIRRQGGRGADGCCAVDRLGRVVGADRAAAAEEGAVASGWAQPPSGSADAVGDPVCAPHRDRLEAPSGGAWVRLGRHLLAAAG